MALLASHRQRIESRIDHVATPVVTAALCAMIVLPRALRGQACSEPNYRWSEKVDTTLATRSATPTDIARMLASWTPPDPTNMGPCAPRFGREESVFVLTGWVRRIELHQGDGDWHIELTETASAAVTDCVLVEIPPERYGTMYRVARAALAILVDTTHLSSRGYLAEPVQARFTGAAFFDGHHELTWLGGSPQAVLHGRCNASVRALWELHPVYRVEAPRPR
jgi:hypothetical protein